MIGPLVSFATSASDVDLNVAIFNLGTLGGRESFTISSNGLLKSSSSICGVACPCVPREGVFELK